MKKSSSRKLVDAKLKIEAYGYVRKGDDFIEDKAELTAIDL